MSLLCSEEERESIPIWNTQDVPLTLATLNTRKRKKSFIVLLLGEKETKDAKKESPPEKHPTLLFTAVVVSFFVLLLCVRRFTYSGIMGFITSA